MSCVQRGRRSWAPTWFVMVALVWGGCSRPQPPLLVNLVPALEHLERAGARIVYFNGAAYPELLKRKPVWLVESDREAGSERVRSLAQAALNPKLFRQMDRQEHFEMLLLAGDPVQYRPLMEHLIKTQDWALDRVDPWSLVYRRGGVETINPKAIMDVAAQWDAAAPEVRAQALAAMAERLVVAGRLEVAGQLVAAATQADPHSSAAWIAEGWYRLARGEWAQAMAAANKALAQEKRNRAALSVKAQGLYFSKHFEEAYELSRGLLADAPEDPVMLFTHAKIAHEVRAFQEEIRLLRKLIGIAEREKRSTSWYRVFLGQALAMTGEGTEAVQSFNQALADPELPADQRDFARSAQARVELRIRPPSENGTPRESNK